MPDKDRQLFIPLVLSIALHIVGFMILVSDFGLASCGSRYALQAPVQQPEVVEARAVSQEEIDRVREYREEQERKIRAEAERKAREEAQRKERLAAQKREEERRKKQAQQEHLKRAEREAQIAEQRRREELHEREKIRKETARREAEAARQRKIKEEQERARLAEQKKLEEQKRLEQQRKLEEQRRLAEQKKLEEQKRLEAQRKLEEQRRREEQKRLHARKITAWTQQYVNDIRADIEKQWKRPPTSVEGGDCVVKLKQDTNGKLLQVTIARCDGDRLYRRSVEDAVWKADPLPLPPSSEVFDDDIEITFRQRY